MPMLGIMASAISGNLWAPAGAYDSISSVTLSASASTITFSGIPATYTHLQIRAFYICTATGDQKMNFNSDTAANYSRHGMSGTGVAANAYGVANDSFIPFGNSYSTTNPCMSTIDILDYANTNKYKTVKTLFGNDTNGNGIVSLASGNWRNTSAVSTIVLSNASGNFAIYSSFALYGVK